MSSIKPDSPGSQAKYWQSLESREAGAEGKDSLEKEFPDETFDPAYGISRRSFVQWMGAGAALAGLSSCKPIRRPELHILPYNNRPESLVPGVPQHYATAMQLAGESVGLVVESHEGRPTKIEGNPKHPGSYGKTGRFHQAAILDLYDPNRSKQPLYKGKPVSQAEFWTGMKDALQSAGKDGGEGLYFLSDAISSTPMSALAKFTKAKYPNSKWVSYAPISRDLHAEGLRAATGKALAAAYDYSKTRRVLALDCDFLGAEPDHVRSNYLFSQRRNPELGPKEMIRLYQVESNYSITGANADHRLRLKPSRITGFAWALALEFRKQGLELSAPGLEEGMKLASLDEANSKWVQAAVADLLENRTHAFVVVGKDQPAALHALAHVINAALGSVGTVVRYFPSVTHELLGFENVGLAPFQELIEAMDQGKVKTLVMLSSNPVFWSPVDWNFRAKLSKVSQSVHLGVEVDETALASTWHYPQSHFLESWDECLAFNGQASIVQPLIAPLFDTTLSDIEFVARLVGNPERKSHQIVQQVRRGKSLDAQFATQWKKWLYDGIIEGTAWEPAKPSTPGGELEILIQRHAGAKAKIPSDGLELLFREHFHVLDGRYFNNAWLQELPDPMTKLTWDNAAIMGPETAERLGIRKDMLVGDEDGFKLGKFEKPMLRVSVNGSQLDIVAWILPGMADETILLNYGYGRESGRRPDGNHGFNVLSLRSSDRLNFITGAKVVLTGKSYKLACTQDHWSLESRPIVRETNVDRYLQNKQFAKDEHANPHPPNVHLWNHHDYSRGMQWGMVIDLNKCTGCNTCTIACQAENNIPVVGKKQVMVGREMHWIRVDRYFIGEVENPEAVFQAMTCLHCENAPCESVCPVNATVHSTEGLNDMAYNRCIGTRYCSNNCPPKVRRFNFFNYTNTYAETVKMQQNPDVTVRYRGVMEKCTYCVQRINQARISNKNQGRERIPDGQVTPACAQACPADAIVFGDINDATSQVSKVKADPRNYGILEGFNLEGRTTYLARVRNQNPALMAKA